MESAPILAPDGETRPLHSTASKRLERLDPAAARPSALAGYGQVPRANALGSQIPTRTWSALPPTPAIPASAAVVEE